jgi:hypothetical protein
MPLVKPQGADIAGIGFQYDKIICCLGDTDFQRF